MKICSSPLRLITSIINLLEIVIFKAFVYKLKFLQKDQMKKHQFKYGFEDQEIKAQILKVRQLNVIIYWFLLLFSFSVIYSGVAFSHAYQLNLIYESGPSNQSFLDRLSKSDICNVVTNDHEIDTWFWVLGYFTDYIFWQYAILWILWPVKGICFDFRGK